MLYYIQEISCNISGFVKKEGIFIMAKVSIKDVAKEAGVSVSSVSFYMNRPERLSDASIARIKAACEKLQYAPGKNRRGPKLGRRSRFKTRNICFYCMHPMGMEEFLRYPTVPLLLGIMQEELHKHHCRLVLSGTGDNCQIPVTLSKKNCDGVILYGKALNQEFYKHFKEKVGDLPVIWTGNANNDEDNEFDHVFYCNKKVAELAVKYIKQKNYKTVAVFNTHPEHPEYRDRVLYFEEIAQKNGIEFYKFETPEEHIGKSPAELNKILVDIFENADVPNLDAAFFCSDFMLIKFCIEMNNRGKKRPDFELVGCNGDTYILSFVRPSPTTVDINLKDIAKQTVKRLLQRIDNYRKPMPTANITIEPKLLLHENKQD